MRCGVYQRNTKDCGVACLLSIIKYYKGCNTFENIRYLTKCNHNGISALNLIDASIKLGFDSRGLRCNYEDLMLLTKPLICHVTLKNVYNHYIVLYKVNEKSVVVFDPYLGKKVYTKEQFLDIWNKVAIELKPRRKLDYIKENYLHYFLSIVKKDKNLYLMVLLLSFFSIILSLVSSYYFKALIDFNNLLSIFIFFINIIIIKEINDLFRNNMIIKLENKILTELNINTHNKLLSLPYYYFNSRTKGDIITKFNDLEYVKDLLVKVPICFFIDALLLVSTSIILSKINFNLFIMFSFVCLIYLLVIIIYDKKIKRLIEDNQECNSYKNTILLENINNINTIKNMNIRNLRNDRFNKVYNLFVTSSINYEKKYTNINFIKNILLFIGLNTILYIGNSLVIKGEITLSNLILFNSLTLYFIEPLTEVCELSKVVKNGVNAIKRVSEIYSINTERKMLDICNDFNISFNNLSFSYNGYDKVLSNINYRINFKDKVMVVGKSGCGKSTLFKLLSKVYEVKRNMIKIDNNDINDISVDNIITYVSEEEKLFNDSILNNIVLDNKKDNIDKILSITGVNNILNKKNLNLDSIIEEEGSNLSKGEKQKIILARVLLKNSKIIILDESLSGIEEEDEYKIMSDVINNFNNITIIYISHSKVCTSLFDKILNFDREVICKNYQKEN